METMDSERLCACPGLAVGSGGCCCCCGSHCGVLPLLLLEWLLGTFRLSVVRWPLVPLPEIGGVRPLPLPLPLSVGFLGVPRRGEGCLWRSAGEFNRATFLKVMRHLTSSPANTVLSSQCTNTRMLPAAASGGIVVAVGSSFSTARSLWTVDGM
jgi:hypothetical protein